MTTELARIEDAQWRVMHGNAWHGPAVLELLEDVDADHAATHAIAGAHSIWELVLHLTSTYRLVLRRLGGDDAPLTSAEDWPHVPEQTSENWRASVTALREANDELRRAVAAFEPARLDDALVAAPPYTAWVQFVGLSQHDAYHAGQIALLKRALSGS